MSNISAAYDYANDQLVLCGEGAPRWSQMMEGHFYHTHLALLEVAGHYPASPDQGYYFFEIYDSWNEQLARSQTGDENT